MNILRWITPSIWTLCVVLIAETGLIAQQPAQQLTVETIYRDLNFYGHLPSQFKWLPESDRFSYLKRDSETGRQTLWLEDARTGHREPVVSSDQLVYVPENGDTVHLHLSHYLWLPDESGIILLSQGDLWHLDRQTGQLRRLTDTEAVEEEVEVSPRGRFLSFVRDYNLYVLNLATGQEIQLTMDGHPDLLNGKLDWVYQEELVGRGTFRGYFWSPDEERIAYLQFDESPVPQYPLVDWGPYHPDVEWMRYPKAGDANPVVRLGVVEIASRQTRWIFSTEQDDSYIPRVYWLPDGKTLAYMHLDRLQQHLEFRLVDVQDHHQRTLVEEQDDAWLNIGDFVHFFERQPWLLWGSERSGYRHLYLYHLDGKLIKTLTSGPWMVDRLLTVDEENGWVYFTATREDVRERQIYRVNIQNGKIQKISREAGTHSGRFSRSGAFYVDYFSSLMEPMSATLFRADGKKLRELARYSENLVQKYGLVTPEMGQFYSRDSVLFYYTLLRPPNFNPDRKYPVVIYTYGGPHGQVVRNAFAGRTFLWHQLLAQRGFIVFSMDNRGSWGRGHAWEKPIYRRMGFQELADQLEGVKFLQRLPYVDGQRMAIWGWSYGGYMTLFALTHSDVFRAGISVAPVTDWRNYDTIYTERYMGLPQDNPDGYRDSSPVFAADSLKGHLLLVHGTYDDNVHLQNSIQMVDRLVDAGIAFQFMVYPNQRHGISATRDRIHLFKTMLAFLETHLLGHRQAAD